MTAAEKTQLLAERVMGWEVSVSSLGDRGGWGGWIAPDAQRSANSFNPLTNLSHAGEVLEAMVRKGFEFDAQDCGVGKFKAWFRGNGKRVHAIAPLLQTAICHAALLAHEVKEDEL